MRIALCSLIRNTNFYLREWVEHHLFIGIDHLFIYDNNRPTEEHPQQVIQDLMNAGKCSVVDYSMNQKKYGGWVTGIQSKAFSECYSAHIDEFDWFAFIDQDEYIQVDGKFGKPGLQAFLQQTKFNSFNAVRLCWKLYTDGNMLDVLDGNYSISRFKVPCSEKHIGFSRNREYKTLLRGRLRDSFNLITEHGPLIIDSACNSLGVRSKSESCIIDKEVFTHQDAWIDHHRTKTIGEWLRNKTVISDSFTTLDKPNLDFFFEYNDRTEEKEKYAEKLIAELKARRNK